MVDENDGTAAESRPPTLADLVALCRALNQENAQYVIIGEMAIIHAGYVRATDHIDLLIDASKDNVSRVRRALMKLPDQAVRDMQDDDIDRYTVVKIADEFVIDLMKKACGIDYHAAKDKVEKVSIEGVSIPFARPELLWELKQTKREKDEMDRIFLRELLKR